MKNILTQENADILAEIITKTQNVELATFCIVLLTENEAPVDVRALMDQMQTTTTQTRLKVTICLYLSPNMQQGKKSVNTDGGR